MKTDVIRQRLQEYIHFAEDAKVQAIYELIEKDFSQKTAWWQNEEVISSLDARAAAIRTGSDQGFSWKEVKQEFQDKKR